MSHLAVPLQTGLKSASSSIFDLPIHGRHDRSVRNRDDGEHSSATRDPTSPNVPVDTSGLCVVISGGTGCNDICGAFNKDTSYVLPVSDDGGSSSEIIRVLGGPSIGDIRSRLIRLIPYSPDNTPQAAIKRLLSFRFPLNLSEKAARDSWRDVVEGKGNLWDGIPSDRKEMIRGFLVFFENEVLRRSHKNFSFRNGSIGNFFLAGAQQFFRSLPSAIFLFSSITNSQANILPAIVTNHTCTLAAKLENSEVVVGQCQISHPTGSSSTAAGASIELEWDDETPAARPDNLQFTKSDGYDNKATLQAPISEIFYINSYGQEIHPRPNPEYINSLHTCEVLIYSCGSLWTSIIPCLALQGVGGAIASSSSLKFKVLLLNSSNDRETKGYNAVDYVQALAMTLWKDLKTYAIESQGVQKSHQFQTSVSSFVTHVVYLSKCEIEVDKGMLQNLGVKCLEIRSTNSLFDTNAVYVALNQIQSKC